MSTESPPPVNPYVPADQSPEEFTLFPVLIGALLGIVFGASSLYLVLKVGLTVSASIPVAVLAITLFRAFSHLLGIRRATILENNIVQTTGSAGESIAFGVGLTMPALLLLGFDLDVVRVMTVGVLGGLLGILMMIPLRRAFIVRQHGKLTYPEGKACADVLTAGEKGGATASMVFLGFGIGLVYQFLMKGFNCFKDEASQALPLKGAAVGAELAPPLLGVGYIIGPRIASIMVAGGVLAYLVLTPMIVYFGENLTAPLPPAISKIDEKTGKDVGLIKNMDESKIRSNYILYIGAGAVAAGGIISMIYALPVIFGSVLAGWRDLKAERAAKASGVVAVIPRTEQDLSMQVVLFGSIGLVLAIALAPAMGLGLNFVGILGAVMIVVFGFLFTTVSARLTGEIGSSSNPISGMTVATLLLTCMLFVGLDSAGLLPISREIKLAALTIASVVCVACSNGGTTAQALKTGHLVGATPKAQQYAILVGALTSALVVGVTLLILNEAGTIYSKKNLPAVTVKVSELTNKDYVRSGPYANDNASYHVLAVGMGERQEFFDRVLATPGASVPPGRYLVNAEGQIVYFVDPAVNGQLKKQDDETPNSNKFEAPKTQLIALIINGILDAKLPWDLVFIGVLIALTLELAGVPSLPFAVGVYLPLSSSVPIFIGGMLRGLADRFRGNRDDGDSGPPVLLSSGYIAGGSIAAVVIAGLEFFPSLKSAMDLSGYMPAAPQGYEDLNPIGLIAFGGLMLTLFLVAILVGRQPTNSPAKSV